MKYKILFLSLLSLSYNSLSQAQVIDLPVKKISTNDITKVNSQEQGIIGNDEIAVDKLTMHSADPVMNQYMQNNSSVLIKTPIGAPPLPNVNINDQLNKFNKQEKKENTKLPRHTKKIGIIKPLDDNSKPISIFNMGGQPTISTGLNESSINSDTNAGNFDLSVKIPNLHMAEQSQQLNELTSSLNKPDIVKNTEASNCHSGNLDELLSPNCLKNINNGNDILPNNDQSISVEQKNIITPSQVVNQNHIKCHLLIKEAHITDHFDSNSIEECLQTALGESEGVSGITNIALQNNNSITIVSCLRDSNGMHPQCHQVKR